MRERLEVLAEQYAEKLRQQLAGREQMVIPERVRQDVPLDPEELIRRGRLFAIELSVELGGSRFSVEVANKLGAAIARGMLPISHADELSTVSDEDLKGIPQIGTKSIDRIRLCYPYQRPEE